LTSRIHPSDAVNTFWFPASFKPCDVGEGGLTWPLEDGSAVVLICVHTASEARVHGVTNIKKGYTIDWSSDQYKNDDRHLINA